MRSLLLLLFVASCTGNLSAPPVEGSVLDDISRLNAVTVAGVVRPTTEAEVVAAVQAAWAAGQKVSISGTRHSQGAHAFDTGSLVLDMTDYDEVLSVDPVAKTVRVQSGASWDDLQAALNPHGLAVLTMQSSNVFTVGGSISANVHGRDPQASLLSETILSLRVLLPDGTVVTLRPDTDPERLGLVVGGYGLFGLILEAELRVTANTVLRKEAVLLDYTEFTAWFEAHIRPPERGVRLFIARPSIAPASLLRETVVTTWTDTGAPVEGALLPLGQEENVLRDKVVFDDSRRSAAGKERRWALQKLLVARPGAEELVSRNNAMRPPTTPLAFLEHDVPEDTDIVQEYFVPIRHFVAFTDAVRTITEAQQVNLLGVTIRFVAAPGPDAHPMFLRYATEDCFSFMLYTNQGRDAAGRARAEAMTRALVDAALALDGRHYLTYQRWPTPAQVERAYPGIRAFFAHKRRLDPEARFSSGFYTHYAPALGQD